MTTATRGNRTQDPIQMKSSYRNWLRKVKRSVGRNPVVFHTYQLGVRVLLEPLNKGQRLDYARKYLKWFLVQKRRGETQLVTLVNGMRSRIYPDSDSGVAHLFNNNVDYHETLFIRNILEKGDFIVDAGCNVGNRTLSLADIAGGGLLVDANANCLARARDNFQLNELPLEHYSFVHSAVGATNTVVEFPDDAGTSCQNRILDGQDSAIPTIRVPMKTVDTLLLEAGNPPVALLKTDLEGYDLEAFRGATGLLGSGTLKLIIFERWPSVALDDFLGFFQEIGWRVFALGKSGQVRTDYPSLVAASNLLAMPEDSIHPRPEG